MNPCVSIRPARPDDAMIAASLMRLTMGRSADLFSDVESGWTSEKLLAALFAHKGGRFSCQVGTVLEVDGKAVGLLVSYPASKMAMLDLAAGRNLLSVLGIRPMIRFAKRISPMMNIREAERGEYYISNVGVAPEFQGNGYGAHLLSFAEEQARKFNLKKCSLIVDEHNNGAIRLYQRSGYKIIFSGKLNGESGYYRMVKELA
ncbi:MAG: GNAT family N-acetyltransferase [Chloroflexi bacterium]|nr:GNAT family N-acetyltransferase [Chloroflexota bacterium]